MTAAVRRRKRRPLDRLHDAKSFVPGPAKKIQRHSPAHANTYVENIAGQVRPLLRERLPAAVLTVWSLCDAVCCQVGDLRRQRASQAAGFAAVSIAAACSSDGGGLPLLSSWALAYRYETARSSGPRGPRPRSDALRQELARHVRVVSQWLPSLCSAWPGPFKRRPCPCHRPPAGAVGCAAVLGQPYCE